ncbi:MAG: DUF5916 domain-containing protein [Planctomycetota bacterium]
MFAGLLLTAALLQSDDPAVPLADTPSVPLARLPDSVERPVIDGVIDDAAWEHATVLGDLVQVVPVAGAEPSERTEVRLVHDADSVFIALRCFDSDPAGIRATQMLRDANLDPDDRVELYFDTFLDRRNAYWFQVGPAGSLGDALITKNGSSFNKDFDAIWYARARVTSEGWEAEIDIPAASINFDPEARSWGFNLRRFIRRRNEVARWSRPSPAYRFFEIIHGGTLTGIGKLDQGLGLNVVPFGVANWTNDRTSDESDSEFDAGVDAFYRVTPNSKLSVSLNTDFAETEVDARIVNLTRFPVFFPEQRDFFLEDSGAFFFGRSSRGGGDVIPFFSRRVGLDDEGGEVPILGAVKWTGSNESYTYGLLDVQTDDVDGLDGQNLAVGRFSKNFFEQSDVGIIGTAGDPVDEGRNSTVGVDLNLRTNRFRGDENLRLSSYILQADSDDVSDQNLAYFASLAYPQDEVDLSLAYTAVERNFDPALGFVRRDDMKKYEGDFRYRPRLYSAIRRLDFTLRTDLITDSANKTETVDITMRPLGIEWESGDEFRLDVLHRREVLGEDFDIQDDVVIPEGAYTYDRVGTVFETADRRPLTVEVSFFTGGFFDGDRDDFGLDFEWRPSAHLLLGGEYELNDVSLPDGNFRVQTSRLRANFLFTPELSWSNFLQYDTVSEELGLNSRLRWILEPGRELNLVVNQGWDYDPPSFSSLSTQAVVKLTYTLRF